MTSPASNAYDQPNSKISHKDTARCVWKSDNSGGFEMNIVIRKLERCEVFMNQMQQFCRKWEIHFDDSENEDILGVFKRLEDMFSENQREANNEKCRRLQAEIKIQELESKLAKMEENRNTFKDKNCHQNKQLEEQIEMIKKLEKEKRNEKEHYEVQENRLHEQLNEERRAIIAAEHGRLDAESKASRAETAKRESEQQYKDLLAVFNKQRELKTQAELEKVELQARVAILEKEKENAEVKLPVFCGQNADNSLQESRFQDHHEIGSETSPASTSMNLPTFCNYWPSRNGSVGYKENRTFASNSVLPPLSSASSDISVGYDRTSGFIGGFDRSRRLLTEQYKWRSENDFPPSVVSSPMVVSNSFYRNNGQLCFGNISPMNSSFAIRSETSDSALIDDVPYAASNQTSELNSYEIGGSSTLLSSEDYDSVNGSYNTGQIAQERINPLIWAWMHKRNVMENALKGGAKITKSLWTWTLLAAVAVGSAGMKKIESEDTAEFSDEEQNEGEEAQSSTYHANDFVG